VDHGDRQRGPSPAGPSTTARVGPLAPPVPPGFPTPTEACRAYLAAGEAPETLDVEVTAHLREVEQAMGRRLGDPSDPLLVSVRSGAKVSMPGMPLLIAVYNGLVAKGRMTEAAQAAAQASARTTTSGREQVLAQYPKALSSEMGGYYTLGRVFVALIERPWDTSLGYDAVQERIHQPQPIPPGEGTIEPTVLEAR